MKTRALYLTILIAAALMADCTAFAVGSFHERFLKEKVLAIACPKLDDGAEVYREKLTALVDHAQINTLTVAIMEVPCCRGLLALAQEAVARARRKVFLKSTTLFPLGRRAAPVILV